MLPSSKTNATDEQSWLRKDVQDSRNRTVYTDRPGNSSLYINYRKGNDYSPVTFSLAVTVGLPCCPGSWSPAPPRHSTAQPRCPGGRGGWRRCKRRCCHLLEPPAAGRERLVQGPAGDCARTLGTQLPKLSCSSSMKSPGHGLRSGLQENANMWQQNWQLLQLQISLWPLFSINKSLSTDTDQLSKYTNICTHLFVFKNTQFCPLLLPGYLRWLFHNLHIYETFFEELQLWTKSILQFSLVLAIFLILHESRECNHMH